jgi:hypothetical protein
MSEAKIGIDAIKQPVGWDEKINKNNNFLFHKQLAIKYT